MKKKNYGFLLGVAMIVIGGVGLFSAFEAEAAPVKNCYNSCRWNPVDGNCYTWGSGDYCLLMKADPDSNTGTCVDCNQNDIK